MADWTDALQVFCADIGSIANDRFAWARRPTEGGEEVQAPGSIEALAVEIVEQLERERPVALGFEMPLFVPVPCDATQLGKARPATRTLLPGRPPPARASWQLASLRPLGFSGGFTTTFPTHLST